MKTERVKVHTGCGGIVEDGVCNKCGKKASNFITRFLKEPMIIPSKDRFDEGEHRKRIREGKDIFK